MIGVDADEQHLSQALALGIIDEAKYKDLRDTIDYLNPDYQKLYNARAALFTKRSADTLISQVPQSLKEDPGLIYDRIKWRRKKSRFDEALTPLPT